MANNEILTDDYVAGLLTKDAKESSIKYSAMGLEAFTQSKPPTNKPKPNTRFLRNIIKDTDSHNAALLAKEAMESRARLKSLSVNDRREEKASQIGRGDIRRRQLGDIAAILGGRPHKRKRTEPPSKSDNGSRRANALSEDEAPAQKSGAHVAEDRHRSTRYKEDGTKVRSLKIKGAAENLEKGNDHRSDRRRDTIVSGDRERSSRGKHRDELEDRGKRSSHKRHKSRSRSPQERESKSSRYRHRSPSPKRSGSPGKKRLHHNKYSPSSRTRDQKEEAPKSKEEAKPEYDSDPLDEIIGPRPIPVPAVRSRGRGAMSFGAGIDSRFSASYDPTTDVQLDLDEEDDWDQALEALRDRQKWNRSQADRLRAAGFTDEEITKWEKGGEKREEDVKWVKRGEGREWDRGKVIDDADNVTFESDWGRLKGT